MSYQLAVRPQVTVDLAKAAAWYDDRESGLGDDFFRAIRDGIETILLDPLLPSIRDRARQIRWVFPRRFPYRIVDRVSGETIVVLAVLHAARHDREWKSRA